MEPMTLEEMIAVARSAPAGTGFTLQPNTIWAVMARAVEQAQARIAQLERALLDAVPQGYIGIDNCPWNEHEACPFADEWTSGPLESLEDAECPHEDDPNEPCWVAYHIAQAETELKEAADGTHDA